MFHMTTTRFLELPGKPTVDSATSMHYMFTMPNVRKPLKRKRVVVYIPTVLYAALQARLAKQGKSVSGWFRYMAGREVLWGKEES